MCVSFTTYFVYFYMKYIPGNLFLNTGVASLMEVASYTLAGFVILRVSLKKATVGSLAISLVFPAIIAYDQLWLTLVCVVCAKVGTAAAFNFAYLANPRVIPASFLSTSFGLCNLTARIATVFAPYAAEMEQPYPIISFAFMLLLGIGCSLLIRFPDGSPEEEYSTQPGTVGTLKEPLLNSTN